MAYQYNIATLLKDPRLPGDIKRQIFLHLPYKDILRIYDYDQRLSPQERIGTFVCDNKEFWISKIRKIYADLSIEEFDNFERLPILDRYGLFLMAVITRQKLLSMGLPYTQSNSVILSIKNEDY